MLDIVPSQLQFEQFDWASDYTLIPGTVLKFVVGDRTTLFTCTGLTEGRATTTGILQQFNGDIKELNVEEARIRLEHPLPFQAAKYKPYIEFIYSVEEHSETHSILPVREAFIAYDEALGREIITQAAIEESTAPFQSEEAKRVLRLAAGRFLELAQSGTSLGADYITAALLIHSALLNEPDPTTGSSNITPL